MNPKISVIIPIHNAGEHLRPCLESISAQTKTDIEVICVLDCPSDGSDNIVREISQHDARIRIIEHQTNKHIGASRNDGIEVAKGSYITFVDHDDICHPQMLELLYNKAVKTNADIVLSPLNQTDAELSLAQDLNMKEWALSEALSGGHQNWEPAVGPILGVLFSSALIKPFQFIDTHTNSAEDIIFLIEALHKAKNVAWINQKLYTHTNHEKNTGRTTTYIGVDNRARAINYLYGKVSSWVNSEEWLPDLYNGLIKQIFRTIPSPLHINQFIHSIHTFKRFNWCQSALLHGTLPHTNGFVRTTYRNVLYYLLKR